MHRIEYIFGMPAISSGPELFEIEAASPETDDPGNETFVIRMRLQGTYEVREFLSDNGVDERRIALAIAELARSGQTRVWKHPLKTRR